MISSEVLKQNQKKIIDNFSLIDNKNFWSQLDFAKDDVHRFENYKVFKTYLREQIILEINKNFKKIFFCLWRR